MSERDERISVGSVVQVKTEANKSWGGCLLIVDEVKPWGVQAYMRVPMRGDAFIRLQWDQIEYIGTATYAHTEEAK